MPENSSTLQLTIRVKEDGSIVVDQLNKKIDDMEKKTVSGGKSIEQTLGGIKAGWIAVSAGAIGAYKTIESFIDAASEAEQIESRMAFQIKAVGYQFDAVKPLVDDFAESVLKMTRFSDEAARQGLGQMMQYTVDLGEAMNATRIAMDVSTQTGMDLGSTVRYVGMAMSGNVEILGRWIPELKDLDSKLGANATKAEKAAYALDVLNSKFGGAAIADLETYKGRWQAIGNQWDEIKEKIGRIIQPGLQNWADWADLLLNTFSPAAKKTGEELKALARIEQEVAEKARLLQRIKEEEESAAKAKAQRSEQYKIDLDYQGKFLALSGQRVDAIRKERDQVLQTAWEKGFKLIEIEKYYSALIDRKSVG